MSGSTITLNVANYASFLIPIVSTSVTGNQNGTLYLNATGPEVVNAATTVFTGGSTFVSNGTVINNFGTVSYSGGTTLVNAQINWSTPTAWNGNVVPNLTNTALVPAFTVPTGVTTIQVTTGAVGHQTITTETVDILSQLPTIVATAQVFGNVTFDAPSTELLLTDNGKNPSIGSVGSVRISGGVPTLSPATLHINAGTLTFGYLYGLTSGGLPTDETLGSNAGEIAIGQSGELLFGLTNDNSVAFNVAPTLDIFGTDDIFNGHTIQLQNSGLTASVSGVLTVESTGTVNVGSDNGSLDNGNNTLIAQSQVGQSVTFGANVSLENTGNDGWIFNAGTLNINNFGAVSAFNIGTVSGSAAGQIYIDNTSTLTINQPYYGGPAGPFTTSGTTLAATPVIESSTIMNITDGGSIEFSALDPAGAIVGTDSLTVAVAGGNTLAIVDATAGLTLAELPIAGLGTLDLAGFTVQDDGSGSAYAFDGPAPTGQQGIFLTYSAPACFGPGTRIRTARGEVPVEAIAVGDVVPTVLGAAPRRVVWTGRRHVEIARHPRPWDMQPVRILAGAFAPGVPLRDLVLSPDHAVFDTASGALIPVRYLINGATIRQESVAAITWHHLELEAHDAVFAEGLPAESYLDTGNRGAFEGEAAVALHPDFARTVWAEKGCAPLLIEGPAVVAARAALLDRAEALGARLTAEADLRVVLASGWELRATPDQDGVYRFALPKRAGVICLASRSAVPAETDPQERDTRRLGVALGGLRLDGEPPAAGAFGPGWYAPEAGIRWTDGDAALDVGNARELLVRVRPVPLRYWDEAATPAAAAAAA